MNFILVFIGGGLGAVARFIISECIGKNNQGFPLATLMANLLSCVVLGYLIGMTMEKSLEPKYSLLLMTGFCGGFSTFSTFSAENYKLLENGNYGLAFVYTALSIILCLGAVFLGLKWQS